MNVLDVLWDNALEVDLQVLFLAQRCLPPVGDVSTPQLLALAQKKEREHCAAFLLALKMILMRRRQGALDLDVLASIEDLKQSHDRAFEEGR